MHSMTCSPTADDSTNLTTSIEPITLNAFESQLRTEFDVRSNVVQLMSNTTNHLEYFLNLEVVGVDESDEALMVDESPIVMELAVVNNDAVTVAPNVTLKAPRRFFRIGIAPTLPWSYMKYDKKTGEPLIDDNGNAIWEGYCIDFAAKLSEVMHFDYELVPTKNGLFGDRVLHMNNTWNGLVGDLMVGVRYAIDFESTKGESSVSMFCRILTLPSHP